MIMMYEQLKPEGIRIIGHIEDIYGALVAYLSGICGYYLALYYDFADLTRDILHRYGIAIEFPAVEHAGSITLLKSTTLIALLLTLVKGSAASGTALALIRYARRCAVSIGFACIRITLCGLIFIRSLTACKVPALFYLIIP